MPKAPKKPAHISQADWDAVESPELSDDFIARMKPVRDAAPELAVFQERNEARRGRPRVAAPKRQQTLRLSDRVIEHFRAKGKKWQTMISDALERYVTREETRLAKRVPVKNAAAKAATVEKAMVKKPSAKKVKAHTKSAGEEGRPVQRVPIKKARPRSHATK